MPSEPLTTVQGGHLGYELSVQKLVTRSAPGSSGFGIPEPALYLNENPSDCSHQPISGIHQSFEVLRCFVLFDSGQRLGEPLYLIGYPVAQILVDIVAHNMLFSYPGHDLAVACVACEVRFYA
jgi:hypothetical protein